MLYGGMLLYGYVVRVARVDCGMLYGGMLLLLLLLLLLLCRSASTFNSQTPIVLCAGSPRHPWQRYLGFSCCAFFWPVPFAIPGQGTWASAFFQHACSPRHPWQRYFGSALGYLGGVVPQRVLRPEHPHSPPENRASRCDRSSPGSPSRTCPTRREATEV